MSNSSGPSGSNRLSLRVADVDRERTAELLRRNYSEGRLTYSELQERLEQAYAARTFGDLETLTSDLPAPQTPRPSRASIRRRRTRNHVITYVTIMLFLIAIWAITGAGYFWPIWPIIGWGVAVVLDVMGARSPRDRPGRERP